MTHGSVAVQAKMGLRLMGKSSRMAGWLPTSAGRKSIVRAPMHPCSFRRSKVTAKIACIARATRLGRCCHSTVRCCARVFHMTDGPVDTSDISCSRIASRWRTPGKVRSLGGISPPTAIADVASRRLSTEWLWPVRHDRKRLAMDVRLVLLCATAVCYCCVPTNPHGGLIEASFDARQPRIRIPRKVVKGASCARRATAAVTAPPHGSRR